MHQLVFATNNQHKLTEVKQLLGNSFDIKTIEQFGITTDIPETSETLQGNAEQKAEYLYQKLKTNVFADDTGLEIEALDGEPGVYSARYAGPQKNSADNTKKVLDELWGVSNRKARFRTVICLIFNNQKYFFEGIVNGEIIEKPTGNLGFGYDPIFIPDGYRQTFAQMPVEIKNKISHRAIAVNKLVEFLKTQL